MLPQLVYFALLGNFNLFWMLTYFFVIRRGQKDKSYGIPFLALAFNTTWDFVGAFISPSPSAQPLFNMVYVLIDLVVLWQVLRWWQSDDLGMGRGWFYFFVALSFAFSFLIYLTAAVDLNDTAGVRLAFVDNLINSIAFIGMFFRRSDLRGQSFYIALCKLIGTGSASLASFLNPWPGTEKSALLPALFLAITILDVLYVVLVWQRSKKLGIDPLRRF